MGREPPMIQGIVTAILICAFMCLCFWVFSPKRRAKYDDASKIPLEREPSTKLESHQTHRIPTGEESQDD